MSQDNQDFVIVKNRKLFCETDKAILIGPPTMPLHSRNSKGKTWIPKVFVSLPFPFEEKGDIADVEIVRWVAEQNDLEYEEV